MIFVCIVGVIFNAQMFTGLICTIGKPVCCTGPPAKLLNKVGVPTYGCDVGSFMPGGETKMEHCSWSQVDPTPN